MYSEHTVSCMYYVRPECVLCKDFIIMVKYIFLEDSRKHSCSTLDFPIGIHDEIKDKQTHTITDRQIPRQTDKHQDRHTQTDRQTPTQTDSCQARQVDTQTVQTSIIWDKKEENEKKRNENRKKKGKRGENQQKI